MAGLEDLTATQARYLDLVTSDQAARQTHASK
jgi:hypothetical protein